MHFLHIDFTEGENNSSALEDISETVEMLSDPPTQQINNVTILQWKWKLSCIYS